MPNLPPLSAISRATAEWWNIMRLSSCNLIFTFSRNLHMLSLIRHNNVVVFAPANLELLQCC